MVKKPLLATAIAAIISGCAVTPSAITPHSIEATAQADIQRLVQEQSVESAISLDEAIARAVLNNRDKKLKALEAALAQGQIELVQHEMLPELTASAGYSKRSEYAASASVNFIDGEPDSLGSNPSYSVSQDKERDTQDVAFTWNILDFGLSYVRAKQHADRYLISKERERKVVHNITQDVRAAYWRAVSAERLLSKVNPLIEQASQALKDSRQVESQRLRSPLEALYYQRELLDILRALQALRQDLMGAKTELAGLMGLKPGTRFDLADVSNPVFDVPELKVELAQMEEQALQRRPELVETHYQKRISAAETKAAMLGLLPGIHLTAGAYEDSNEYLLNQDWTSFGAQISWNLFDVFKIGAERRMAETREALAEEQRLAASMAVLTQVHLSRIRYEQALKSFDLATEYLGVAERIGEQTRNAAQSKRMSQLDLIRESLNTLLAELRRDVAYADLQNSYGRVYVTMGMDLLPENYQQLSVEELGQLIGQQFSQWQSGQLEQSAVETSEAEEAVAPSEDALLSGEPSEQPVAAADKIS
ncbi:TolC family protein [Marinobacterium sp. D7]|uniref:TolC family protein n=1 Tax=Marinobacterium ramblicola TaxID=2849041 RepID=UPI001C2D2C7A|nr:TolC family protein [Marinobacterium ramblicola]MBV1786433.1 TolC family protein [Marinobacterium ramblicola]